MVVLTRWLACRRMLFLSTQFYRNSGLALVQILRLKKLHSWKICLQIISKSTVLSKIRKLDTAILLINKKNNIIFVFRQKPTWTSWLKHCYGGHVGARHHPQLLNHLLNKHLMWRRCTIEPLNKLAPRTAHHLVLILWTNDLLRLCNYDIHYLVLADSRRRVQSDSSAPVGSTTNTSGTKSYKNVLWSKMEMCGHRENCWPNQWTFLNIICISHFSMQTIWTGKKTYIYMYIFRRNFLCSPEPLVISLWKLKKEYFEEKLLISSH